MKDLFFFFNDTATTEIYTLSLHDALPICGARGDRGWCAWRCPSPDSPRTFRGSGSCSSPTSTWVDRKSTRLNSSHGYISYAVFCLKKKTSLSEEIQTTLPRHSTARY